MTRRNKDEEMDRSTTTTHGDGDGNTSRTTWRRSGRGTAFGDSNTDISPVHRMDSNNSWGDVVLDRFARRRPGVRPAGSNTEDTDITDNSKEEASTSGEPTSLLHGSDESRNVASNDHNTTDDAGNDARTGRSELLDALHSKTHTNDSVSMVEQWRARCRDAGGRTAGLNRGRRDDEHEREGYDSHDYYDEEDDGYYDYYDDDDYSDEYSEGGLVLGMTTSEFLSRAFLVLIPMLAKTLGRYVALTAVARGIIGLRDAQQDYDVFGITVAYSTEYAARVRAIVLHTATSARSWLRWVVDSTMDAAGRTLPLPNNVAMR